MRRLSLVLVLLTAVPALQGCLIVTAADAVGTVAVVGVKTGVKATGAVVGLAADGVSAAGHAVTGTGKKRDAGA